MDELNLYEEVAKVVGEEMNKAFTSILQKLADGDTSEISSFPGPEAGSTQDKINAFFSILNGAELGIGFKSKVPKGTGALYFANSVQGSGLPEVSGSVSIGVNINF